MQILEMVFFIQLFYDTVTAAENTKHQITFHRNDI